MNSSPRPSTPLYTQMDAALTPPIQPQPAQQPLPLQMQFMQAQMQLMRDMLTALDRQSELLEQLVTHVTMQHKQRQQEMAQWKQANTRLSKDCKYAADQLARTQTEYLQELTSEINTQLDGSEAGDFVFNELIDRYGPRLAHLNGMLQVLSQLGHQAPEAGLQ